MDHEPPVKIEQARVVREYIRPLEKMFGNDERNQSADLRLNTQGWTRYSEPVGSDGQTSVSFHCPEELQAIQITPLATWSDARSFLVWDPELAEVHHVMLGESRRFSTKTVQEEMSELKQNGYEFVDSTPRSSIFARKLPGVPPVAIPQDIVQNKIVMLNLPSGYKKLG